MATLILTVAGSAVGGKIGGAVGTVIGQTIDGFLFAPKARHGPRLGDLAVQTSSYGSAIPKLFGTMRVAGTVIWATDLIERRSTSGGGKGRAKSVDYSYAASFAVALSARPVTEVRRIWADGKLLRGVGGDFKVKTGFRLHHGDENQAPDPLIAAAEGIGQAPAFRGIAYALFEEMELADYGNRIPSLSFEVVAEAGPVTAGAIAAELAPDVVAGAGTPELLGYAASGDSVRGAIEELALLDGLALTDDGEMLTLAPPGGAVLTLPAARESGRRELVRQAGSAAPGEVTLAYYDPERDHQAGLQRAAAGPPAGDARTERIGLAAALSAAVAKERAERRLDAAWAERSRATVTCGWWGADIKPGSRIALSGERGLWRVRRRTIGDMRVKLELVRIAGGGGESGAADPGRPVAEMDAPHGPTMLRLLDLPLAELAPDGQAVLAVLAAGTQEGWRRAMLSASFDGGTSWVDVGSTAAPAVLGIALTALAPSGAALFDLRGPVEVELLHDAMVLTGCDEDGLVAGANLALIGGELVQFGAVEAVGPRIYRLSRLLRGRRGTEWAASGHVAGEDFALIETEAVRPIALPAGVAEGAAVEVLASGVGDSEPAAAECIVSVEAMRPPGPVHLRAAATADGGVMLRWVRRSRTGWVWQSGADTPLEEENELYLVTLAGPGFTRTIEVAEPFFLHDAAARAADGGGPVSATIVQRGTCGLSRPATIILD